MYLIAASDSLAAEIYQWKSSPRSKDEKDVTLVETPPTRGISFQPRDEANQEVSSFLRRAVQCEQESSKSGTVLGDIKSSRAGNNRRVEKQKLLIVN